MMQRIINFWNCLLGVLKRYWVCFGIIAVIVVSSLIAREIYCFSNNVDYVFKIFTGGLTVIGFILLAWRSKIAEKQVQQFKKQLAITSKGQHSDRFVKSVEQIANQNLAIRLGGLASLHALSKENKEEYQRVWTYLGSFLRYRPSLDKDEPTRPFPDVADIAKMLRERDKKRIEDYKSEFKLDLEGANLEGANLDGANLERAKLWKANLKGASLGGAHLEGAYLEEAHLGGAHLRSANLEGANLRSANLEGADLWGANLEGADLWGAHLEGAHLEEAHLERADLRRANLEGANLRSANLEGANLEEANLEGAHLVRANLVGADLVGANLVGAHLTMADLSGVLFGKTNGAQDLTNLTPEQFKGTYYLNDDGYHVPKLPDNLPDECKPKPISGLEWNRIRAITIIKVS